VVGEELLQIGVELEALDPVLLDQASYLAGPERALGRVDTGEGDEDVGVGGRGLGDLLVGHGGKTAGRLGVDGKDHAGHGAFAVVTGDLFQGGSTLALDPEVGARGPVQVLAEGGSVSGGGDLGVGVDVDGGQAFE